MAEDGGCSELSVASLDAFAGNGTRGSMMAGK